MSTNIEAGIPGHQLPLPLVDPVGESDGGDRPDTRPDAEWRLDEYTRMVGRQGIAAARARLRTSSTTRRTGEGRGTDTPAGQRAPGRAG